MSFVKKFAEERKGAASEEDVKRELDKCKDLIRVAQAQCENTAGAAQRYAREVGPEASKELLDIAMAYIKWFNDKPAKVW